MKTENRINKTFGPVGSFAGIVIFFSGLIATILFSNGKPLGIIVGIIVTITGAFVGFSNSSVFIDGKHKRVRFSNNIFGIIHTGKWVAIESGMKIRMKLSKTISRSYSRSNRILDIPSSQYYVILFDSDEKAMFPLFMSDTKENAKGNMVLIAENLDIPYESTD
jgi:uncharacterized membrane protein YeaQ/YmgE (transglycosylase-associated protein family)